MCGIVVVAVIDVVVDVGIGITTCGSRSKSTTGSGGRLLGRIIVNGFRFGGSSSSPRRRGCNNDNDVRRLGIIRRFVISGCGGSN